jgi:hypothetical protein
MIQMFVDLTSAEVGGPGSISKRDCSPSDNLSFSDSFGSIIPWYLTPRFTRAERIGVKAVVRNLIKEIYHEKKTIYDYPY